VVSKFLRDNQSLRNDGEVHKIRKAVLRDAKKTNSSTEETKEHLELELSKLKTSVP
jgi:hypothetical protein